MAFLLKSQVQDVSGKMNNLLEHHGAGPPEARGPLQLHRLHWLKAGPAQTHPKQRSLFYISSRCTLWKKGRLFHTRKVYYMNKTYTKLRHSLSIVYMKLIRIILLHRTWNSAPPLTQLPRQLPSSPNGSAGTEYTKTPKNFRVAFWMLQNTGSKKEISRQNKTEKRGKRWSKRVNLRVTDSKAGTLQKAANTIQLYGCKNFTGITCKNWWYCGIPSPPAELIVVARGAQGPCPAQMFSISSHFVLWEAVSQTKYCC